MVSPLPVTNTDSKEQINVTMQKDFHAKRDKIKKKIEGTIKLFPDELTKIHHTMP